MTECDLEVVQCSAKLEGLVDAPPGCVSYPRDGDGLSKASQEQPATSSVSNSDICDSSLNHCMEPSSTGNGVVVTVTRYPVDRPLSSSSLQPSSDMNTPPDPFNSEGMEKGLSCLSLEVMTSGEHLNTLSLEDLSSHGSGQDSAPESACSEEELEGEGQKGEEFEPERSSEGEPEDESQKGEELKPERGSGGEGASVEEELEESCPKDVTAIVEGLLGALINLGHVLDCTVMWAHTVLWALCV